MLTNRDKPFDSFALTTGLYLLFLSFLILFNKMNLNPELIIFIAIGVLLTGIYRYYLYIETNHYFKVSNQILVILGSIEIVLSIMLFFSNIISLNIELLIIAIWIIISSLIEIKMIALTPNIRHWYLLITRIFGVLGILTGIILIIMITISVPIITIKIILGIFFLIYGLLLSIRSF